MTSQRAPAVAGSFYPANPADLESEVQRHLADARARAPEHEANAKAFIVPHAGYRYSGPIAASAYRQLEARRSVIRRVVLLGPAHRVGLRGLGVHSADAFVTPLGEVPIDHEAVSRALTLPQVSIHDGAHRDEHSLEVQLPFLQCVLDEFRLVPFCVGDAEANEVAEVLELLWGGDETLILVSSDLSHFLDDRTARSVDAATTRAIENLDIAALDYDSACGRNPMRGLLVVAERRGLRVRTLDLRNSADTAGEPGRVVGYGAYAFEESGDSDSPEYDVRDRETLLSVARSSIEHGLSKDAAVSIDAAQFSPKITRKRACFVTLKRKGELRGCIGTMEATRPLVEEVAERAFAAGFRDPRFDPLRPDELADLRLEISVLSPLEPMHIRDEADLLTQLRPGIDGLLICEGNARGTFLPSVWESLPEPKRFLAELKAKARLSRSHVSDTMRFFRFTTESIG